MLWLRTVPTRRLAAACAALVAIVGGAAVALAAGSGPTPAPKPLAVAIHDALAAPTVPGVSADITFTNHLIPSSSIQGSDPLLSGATGRLWVAADSRLRLELQASGGDVQVASDGTTLTVYDAGSQTTYKATLPARHAHGDQAPPTVADIQKRLDDLMRDLEVSGAMPTNAGGRAAYSVRLAPRHDGGLLASAEVAWDAARGVPLRAAIYAKGNAAPVLELAVDDISFGPVPASTLDVQPPTSAKTVTLAKPSGADTPSGPLTFTPIAPATLAGRTRSETRRVDVGDHPGVLITYGKGLSGIAVLESPHDASSPDPAATPSTHGHDQQPGLSLPTADINGSDAQVLDTAVGSVLRYTRSGIDYVVAGSVAPDALRAAARAL